MKQPMRFIAAICLCLTNIAQATDYYVSATGSDAANGLAPAAAIRSIDRLNALDLKPGDVVRFKRGDLFRGSIEARNGVTYGAYGAGTALPTICGSRRDYADPTLWVETETPHVWRCTEKLCNVGIVLFDADPRSIPNNAPVAEMRLPKCNEPHNKPTIPDSDLTFCNLFHEDRLLLRSDTGNPGTRFRHIEIGTHGHCIRLQADDVLIENLHLTLTGSHGAGGSGSRRNITVRNCQIDWLGGSIVTGCKSGTVRFGNAIEIWGACQGFRALNNRIANIYDTGVTVQCSDRTDSVCKIEDALFASNVIDNCFRTFEHRNRNNAPGSHTRNLRFVDNLCRGTGCGWGCKGRKKQASAVSIGETPEGSSGIAVQGNRLLGSTGPLVLLREPIAPGSHAFAGNVYAQRPGDTLLAHQPPTETFAATGENWPTTHTPFDQKAIETIREKLGDSTARAVTLPKQHAPFAVDFSKRIGRVKPLNGLVGAPPISGTQTGGVGDRLIKPLKIPFYRFHDDPLMNPGYALVDVSRIFPVFDADANDPKNYNFEPTDDYLRFCVESNAEIDFRLGESIEHAQKNYRALPPRDPQKWAEICAHIVRHYNAGWANGFHWNIRYWSIWEEPTNQELFRGKNAYAEKYLPLYETTAKRLKREFPRIFVGGPNCQGTGRALESFVDYCRDTKTPIDFLCWTAYERTPELYALQVEKARAYLDCRGFTQTKIGISEWHYGPASWSGFGSVNATRHQVEFVRDLNSDDAVAFTAATLIRLQDTPVDALFFYDIKGDSWGILNSDKQPQSAYYALLAFADFPSMHRVSAETAPAEGWYVLAAEDDNGRGQILIAGLKNSGRAELILKGNSKPASVRAIDAVRTYETVNDWRFDAASGKLSIPRPYGESGVWLIETLPRPNRLR